jgi:glycosyltransferase involved in cell wall biosynthesis
MSVCAVLLVKDEADTIEHVVRHFLAHVDQVIVQDNDSHDGTTEIIAEVARGNPEVRHVMDYDLQHYQSRKMTALALQAFELGHRWVIPCDGDELWYAPEGRTLRDWLAAVGGETQFVKAAIYNHVCTSHDRLEECPGGCGGVGWYTEQDASGEPEQVQCECMGNVEPNPFKRIGWRKRVPLDIRWGKVACRCRPDLRIANGSHEAYTTGTGTTGFGLEIRHFPYRSAEQFVRKAVTCYQGLLNATEESEGTGAHCRAYGKAIEEGGPEAGYAWFRDAFFSEDPEGDDSLVYDPARIDVPAVPEV